jgi:hypothetical protein
MRFGRAGFLHTVIGSGGRTGNRAPDAAALPWTGCRRIALRAPAARRSLRAGSRVSAGDRQVPDRARSIHRIQISTGEKRGAVVFVEIHWPCQRGPSRGARRRPERICREPRKEGPDHAGRRDADGAFFRHSRIWSRERTLLVARAVGDRPASRLREGKADDTHNGEENTGENRAGSSHERDYVCDLVRLE